MAGDLDRNRLVQDDTVPAPAATFARYKNRQLTGLPGTPRPMASAAACLLIDLSHADGRLLRR